MAVKQQPVVPEVILPDRLYKPAVAFQAIDVRHTKGWSLIASGDLETVSLGGRCRRVKGASIIRLMQVGVSQ